MSITAAELASIQADVQAVALDKPCQIWRAPTVSDTWGSPSRGSYVQIAPAAGKTLYAGMAQPTAGELANYDYLIGDKAAWTVRLPLGTDVAAQDHIIIEGHTLEIHVLLTPQSIPVLLSVIAAEIK